ncbi:MAG: vpr [Friedmanniella sp.]|nr:vpr [Friedmanniella sp.]
MSRRRAVGGVVLALAATTFLVAPAQAEPPGLSTPLSGRGFQRLDTGHLGKVLNLPAALDQDRTVSALVQLTGDPVAVLRQRSTGTFSEKAAERQVRAGQDKAIPRLTAAGATPYGRLDTVLNAVQVRVKVSDLSKLAALREVKAIQVSQLVKADNSRSNVATGTDRAWQYLGRTGKGRTIGVIDTGIDYTHADFGGAGTTAAYQANDGTVIEPGSFPTVKVTGGYDLVGDAYDPSSNDPAVATPHPDPDPLDCEGHGTHVAGTAAGSGVTTSGATYTGTYNRSTTGKRFDVEPGAAPEAKLKAYRIFGCSGAAGDDVIVAAIDRATSDHVDVLNMSLGSSLGTADNLNNVAIANATAAGVLVVVSAGNSGAGAYLLGTPAASDTALAVAASDNEFAKFPGASISGAVSAKGLIANGVAIPTPLTGTLVDVGLGCSAADYAGVAGQIALTTRGECGRTDRAVLGQQAGAKAVIMVNTDTDLPPYEGDIAGVTIPFVGVSSTAGPALRAASGEQVTVAASTPVTNPGYGKIAPFSSNGPRRGDSAQKPDVTAPGVSVPSAAVGTGTGSVRESGTSMAAPHTAGVAALVRQSHPTWTPRQVKAVLQATARPSGVKAYDSQRAGTGLVQAETASRAKVYTWTSSDLNSLKFGMNELSGTHTESQLFHLANRSSKTVTYNLSTTMSTSKRGADLTVSPGKVTVKAGKNATVHLTLRLTTGDLPGLPGADASDGGVVSSIHGLVTAKPSKTTSDTPTLQTSFLFVPVPVSLVRAQREVKPTSGGAYQKIAVTNSGRHSGESTLYSWLLADAAGDVADREVADLTNLGVATYPGTVVGESSTDRFLTFSVTQAIGTSTHSSQAVEIALDVNGDGQTDYYTIGADVGLLLAGDPDGTYGSFTVDARSGELVDAWSASAPANGSTVVLPVLASRLGVNAETGPIRVPNVAGYSVVSGGQPDVMSGPASYDPFAPVTSSGTTVVLKPGQSTSLAVKVDEAELGRQTHAGWLVVTPDDRAGLEEGDRVALVGATTPPVQVDSTRR